MIKKSIFAIANSIKKERHYGAIKISGSRGANEQTT